MNAHFNINYQGTKYKHEKHLEKLIDFVILTICTHVQMSLNKNPISFEQINEEFKNIYII